MNSDIAVRTVQVSQLTCFSTKAVYLLMYTIEQLIQNFQTAHRYVKTHSATSILLLIRIPLGFSLFFRNSYNPPRQKATCKTSIFNSVYLFR